MDTPNISLMKQRRYKSIPVDQIKVINSRLRAEEQFQLKVQSIESVGLMMPIRVNDRFLRRTGKYELICGEGRLIAHQRLEKKEILAEVVSCTRKDAYLQSLIENLARSRPGTMDSAREIKRLHDEGWDYRRIGRIICRSPEYVRQYIGLIEKGEDRLLQGVESGVFPITFAVLVAQSQDASVQNVLMDAFDQGIVNCQNFAQARKIIKARFERVSRSDTKGKSNGANLTVKTLKRDISDMTKAKDGFVREARAKENRFLTLLTAINTLWRDPGFIKTVEEEHLVERPRLVGNVTYEQ